MKFPCTLITLCVAGILFAQRDSSFAYHARDSVRESNTCFLWGPDFTAAYNYRFVASNNYQELVKCRDEHEHGALLWNFGLLFHFHFSKHFGITTGIRQVKTGFSLKESIRLNDTLDLEYGAACDVYHAMDPVNGWKTPYIFSDPRYGFLLNGYHPSEAELTITVSYTYIEVPVTCRFFLGKHRSKFFMDAGMLPNYLMRQKIQDEFKAAEGFIGSTGIDETPDQHIQRMNVSISTGAGICFRTQKNINLLLHTSTQWQLRELFNQKNVLVKDYHEHHYRIEAGISVCYHIVRTEDKH